MRSIVRWIPLRIRGETPTSVSADSIPRIILLPLRLWVGMGFLLEGVRHLVSGIDAWKIETLDLVSSGIASERVYAFHKWILATLVLPHIDAVALIVLSAHLVVGSMLIAGGLTRAAAAAAILMNSSFVLTRGHTLIGPHTDGLFLAMELAILTGAAGRCVGIDALLTRRRGPGWLW